MTDSNSSRNPLFLQVPNEILVRIFADLDFRSLIKTTRTCRRFRDFYKNHKNRYFNRKYKSVKIEYKREDFRDQGHYVLQVQDLQKHYQILIFADDAQKNALPHSQTLVLNGQRVDEDYLISKESEFFAVHRVYSTDPSVSVAFRMKKYLHQQIDYFSAKGINLDDLLSKLFPEFVTKEPKFTWHPAIKYFELNEVTFASTLVFWEWKNVLEFFSPIIMFKLVDVTANCNGRSDKMIKRDLLMRLEKQQIPRVHLNRLIFDFETKDNTELKYNLPIEYYEKEMFVIDTDSLLNELERWYLGKRKIEYWRIDVSSERAWKHLKEWINQKGTHVKKTQLGFVVTGAVKNQANQWLYLKAKGGFFIASKNSFG